MRVGILGDGLTSLTLAKAFVNMNINVEVYSEKKKQIIDQSRTIGITKSNLEFFSENIINIEKIIWRLNKIEINSQKLPKEELIKFENNNDQLFSMVRNNKLYKILEINLKKNKFYKISYKKNLLSILDKHDLIINLNPINLVSKKFFSNKIKKSYQSVAYTAHLKHNKIKNRTASQIFTKIGPLAFLPLSDTETSVVYSINKSDFIKKEKFIELINYHNSKYKIKQIIKISSFELNSINLRCYYYKNILAFGDLIHKIHPLAGQGFNMTIRDIKILLKIIKNKIELGLPIDTSVNQEFQNKIKHTNFIFSNGIDFVYEFFNIDRKIKNNALIKSLKFFGKTESLNKIFKKIADKGLIY